MQRYLDQAGGPASVRRPSNDSDRTAPRLVRPAPAAESAAVPPPAPEVEGSFVEFVCLEKSFKVVVDTSQGQERVPDSRS